MKITAALFAIACVILGCTLVGSALASDAGVATTSNPDAGTAAPIPASVDAAGDDPVDTIGQFVQAVKAGDWREATGLALILAVALMLWAARKFSSVGDWIKERDWAGVLVTFLAALLGALGSALLGEQPVDLDLFVAAFRVGVAAVAGYAVLWKKLVLPFGKWLWSLRG